MTNLHHRRSGARFRLRITLTVSVTLMLLVLGLVAFSLVAGRNISRDIHEQAGFVVVLAEDATAQQADSMTRLLSAAPYTAKAQYVSADKVMERWRNMMGDDAGIPDINPFLPEIEVAVHEQWAESDSLETIAGRLAQSPMVSDISMHADMIDSVNSVMHAVNTTLLTVGAVLLLITLALINNTVRLTVYSQRFVINTMKLVGATAAFIRRPFVVDAMLHGAIAGGIAVAVLCGAICYVDSISPSLRSAMPLYQAAWVLGGVWIAGILICTLAALLATNKYLRLGYDDMYK